MYLAFADKEVGNLFGAAQLEVAVLVTVIKKPFVAVSLAALRNIEIDNMLTVNFYRFVIQIESWTHQLGVVHVFCQSIKLFLYFVRIDAYDLSMIVYTQYDMTAPAVEECTDRFIDRTGKALSRSLELDFRPLFGLQ